MTRATPRPRGVPSAGVAGRLRELRLAGFADRPVTQKQIADALGLTTPSISAYEKSSAAPPPESRLRDYATFFATERSIADGRGRLVPDSELTDEERARRDALVQELLALGGEPAPEQSAWSFPEGDRVRIVCGQLDDMTHPYADPANPNYTELLTYADLDALMELYAHVWRTNPTCDIRFLLHEELTESEDLQSHLVILGGSGLRRKIQHIVRRTDLPVRQLPTSKAVEDGDPFDLGEGTEPFLPTLDDDFVLVEDVGLFARLVNPFNSARTLTLCTGVFSRGVQGAVRVLTDAEFRDRNEDYLARRFAGAQQFAVLMSVPVHFGQVVTPDLTDPDIRLFEWSP